MYYTGNSHALYIFKRFMILILVTMLLSRVTPITGKTARVILGIRESTAASCTATDPV